MRQWILFSAIAVMFVTAQSSAQSSFLVRGHLTGFEEVNTLSTPASGEFVARVTNDKIVYRFSYSGLPTTTLFAHIHLGASGTNGGVAAFLCGGSTKPTPCPNFSGEVTGTIVAADVVGPAGQGIGPGEFSEFVRAIRRGVTYANLHTTQYSGGEIRGQLSTEIDD